MTKTCPECGGSGRAHGTTTINPSEKPRDLGECFYCGGSGERDPARIMRINATAALGYRRATITVDAADLVALTTELINLREQANETRENSTDADITFGR